MTNKLKYLTKVSLNKKIKTKWFLIANLIFAILIIGLVNIDFVIKIFGGDFDKVQEILVVDNIGCFDDFKMTYDTSKKYLSEYDNTEIILYDGDVSLINTKVMEEEKIILVIDTDDVNYVKAKIVSNEELGTITNTLISSSLNSIRSKKVLDYHNISPEIYADINGVVEIEKEILGDENSNNMIAVTIMQIITMPLFILIVFLIQMIGAEINDEKSTKSMEIIISNVSPKTHFLSKVLSSNLFVIIQGALLIVFVALGIGIRYINTSGNLLNGLSSEMSGFVDSLSINGVMDTIWLMFPVLIFMIILTFIAYSLMAGILASMTTNVEDFQQLQTPIIIISLVGYYLSMMVTMFDGSLFIRIMSYVPFISSMLAPTLYVVGEIGVLDLVISILLLLGTIYILMKYGLRIYKVGILNYSQTGLWKKMFKAIREK